MTAKSFYAGWKGLEFYDANGNEILIILDDGQFENLSEQLVTKAKTLKARRFDRLKEELEELEDAENANVNG